MYNENLEKDLRSYAKKKNNKLFTEKLYQPLTQLLKWICSNKYRNITYADFQDMQQVVMIRVMKDIKYYKPNKGMKAVSFVRMLMSQELNAQKKQMELNKQRNMEYEPEKDTRHIEIVESKLADYQHRLSEHRNQAPANQKEIITAIINLLAAKETYELNYIERLNYLSKTTNRPKNQIINVIKEIRALQIWKEI